ncbi:MAG: hypothetical protein R3200_13370, partial [Xanthomonadales bacterium]|nr:hypothetical protein [Xanthomonadales bacterium]
MPFLLLALVGGLAYPGLRFDRPLRILVGAVFVAAALLSPLLAPADSGLSTRLLVIFASGFVAMKFFDLFIGAARADSPSLRSYLAFLANPCLLVWRRRDAEPQVPLAENFRRLVRDAAQIAIGLLVLKGFWVIRWDAMPFWLEHGFKAVGFYLGVLGLFGIIAALWRLAGGV